MCCSSSGSCSFLWLAHHLAATSDRVTESSSSFLASVSCFCKLLALIANVSFKSNGTIVYLNSPGPLKSWNNSYSLSNLKNEYTTDIYTLLRPRWCFSRHLIHFYCNVSCKSHKESITCHWLQGMRSAKMRVIVTHLFRLTCKGGK